MPIAIAGRRNGTDTVWNAIPATFWFAVKNARGKLTSGVHTGLVPTVGGGPWNKMRVSPFTQFGDWGVLSPGSGVGNAVELYNGKPGMVFDAQTSGQYCSISSSFTPASLPSTDYFYCAAFIPRDFTSGGSAYRNLPTVVGQEVLDEGFGLAYGQKTADNSSCGLKAFHCTSSGVEAGPLSSAVPFQPCVAAVLYQSGVMYLATNSRPAVSQAVSPMSFTGGRVRIGGGGASPGGAMGGVIFEVVFATSVDPSSMDFVIEEMCKEYGIPFSR